MITQVRINFNFEKIAAEVGHVDDVYALVTDAFGAIADRLSRGETAGDIRRPYYDPELDAWDSIKAAEFEVVDEDGRPIIDLHEVV